MTRILREGYALPFTKEPQPASFNNNRSALNNKEFVTKEILDLLSSGRIREIDISEVHIHPAYQKFLAFAWSINGQVRYFVLVVGLSSAPFVFTKVLKVLINIGVHSEFAFLLSLTMDLVGGIPWKRLQGAQILSSQT